MKRDFDFYFIAYQLGLDVDEVMSWSPEKFERWRIFFKIMFEEQKKAVEAASRGQNFGGKRHLFVFR